MIWMEVEKSQALTLRHTKQRTSCQRIALPSLRRMGYNETKDGTCGRPFDSAHTVPMFLREGRITRHFFKAGLCECGGCASENKWRRLFLFCIYGIAFHNFTALAFHILHRGL